MKPSTLLSFVTLTLVSTNVLASALPPETSNDGTDSIILSPVLRQRDIEDDFEPILLSDKHLTSRSRNTRRSRFIKQVGKSPIESAALETGHISVPPGTSKTVRDPQHSDTITLSSTPSSPIALQSRDLVRKQVPDVDPGAIANSTLHDISPKTVPKAMSFSSRTAHLISAVEDNHQLHTLKRSLQSIKATLAPNTKRDDDDDDLLDIKYLNYGLVIEQLLHAYYLEALRRFSEDDFKDAGLPDWVRGRFKEMAEHERMHKEFLESAIVATGSDHVQPANYDFQDQDLASFIDTSMALESIAASAYIGILQFFNNKAYVTAEAAMLADRSRQAAWINSAVRKQNPWNTAFETPLTPQQVFTLFSAFFNDETSPKTNKALLPDGLQPFPRLTLSPRLVPGEQAEISFPYSEPTDGEPNFLYVAFMSGVETIIGRVLDREEGNDNDGQTLKRHFVEIPRDLASRGVVYVIVLRGSTEAIADVTMDDDSVVAGPAIAMFPFDARGNPI